MTEVELPAGFAEDIPYEAFDDSVQFTFRDRPAGPTDLNEDGFVDEINNYQMWTASGGVDLVNRRGKTYSDDSSRMWDAIKAVETNSGFSVLVEGQRNKDGKYKVAIANDLHLHLPRFGWSVAFVPASLRFHKQSPSVYP